MWSVRGPCVVLIFHLVAGAAGQELAGGGEENIVRGDNIVPDDSDYDYSQFLPGNDFHVNDFQDDVCDNEICWSSICSGAEDLDNTMQCGCCPNKRPVKLEDIDLTVSCSPSGAVVRYNLTDVLGFGLENLTVVLSYQMEGEQDSLDSQEVENFDDTEFSWPGLCSGVSYQFCVEVTHADMSNLDEGNMCQACTAHGPPASNPSSLLVSGGLTYLSASWPGVSPQCDDLTYQVLLNGVPQDQPTDKTSHMISFLDPGLYNVSVRAENNEGHSTQPLPSTLYTIREITPPVDVQVMHAVVNGSLTTQLSWNKSIELEEESITRRGYLLNLYNSEEEDVPRLTENFTWDEMETSFIFDSSLSWNTKFSLQTFFGNHKSNETELTELFSNAIELSPPEPVTVRNVVINDTLAAVIDWVTSVDDGFEGLGVSITLWTKDNSELYSVSVSNPQNTTTVNLENDLPWDTMVTLRASVGDALSQGTDPIKLFSALKLPAPVNMTVTHTVENDTLTVEVEWEDAIVVDGYATDQGISIDGMGTVVKLWDEERNLLRSEKFPLSENSAVFTLDGDLPWNTQFTLQTFAMEDEGDKTDAEDLFSGVALTAPVNVTVTHRVENDTLTVGVEWEDAIVVDGYTADQGLSIDGMGTVVKLWDEESNLLRSEKVLLSENSAVFTLDGELPWNTQFTLQTFAMKHEGDKTDAEDLFSRVALTAPVDILVEYLVIDDTLTAQISWAHSVQDVFSGLHTSIDLWDGDTIINTTTLPHTENSISCALGSPVSWHTRFTLQTTAMHTKGGQTGFHQIFGGFRLSPPGDISVKHSYRNGILTAIVTWENAIENRFDGLQTVLNLVVEDERYKRSESNEGQRTFFISYEVTEAKFESSELPWNTKFTLQSAVGDRGGPESEPIDLFSDVNFDPPGDISVTPEIIDEALVAVISWNHPNEFEDKTGPPVKIKLWDEADDGEMKLIEEKIIPHPQNQVRISLDEGYPWQTRLSMQSDFGSIQGIQSTYFDLFNHIELSPPTNITIIANESSSSVEWLHSLELGQFHGLGTILNIWVLDPSSSNLTLLNQTLLPDTNAVFSVVSGLPHHAGITLQSYVGTCQSNHTDLMALFAPLALKQTQLNRILLIVGLTCLLIIYILATAYCLWMVKRKGTYALKEKHETFTPGKFSESDHLLPTGTVKPPLLSEDGSYTTEQESIVSDNSMANLVPNTPYLGESMITLNKFNDDDDFMGNFDEDGSFIGDYLEQDEQEAQAIQNKLLVFQRMYRANGTLYT